MIARLLVDFLAVLPIVLVEAVLLVAMLDWLGWLP